MRKRKLVVLTGAGMSAESGICTFRDSDGLWEGHDVREVATPEAWHADYRTVLRFYNERRARLRKVEPNLGHFGLVDLEKIYDVTIVTQNIDDLHERAGSSNIVHLHGELRKARSQVDPNYIVDLGEEDIEDGALCPHGSQLRPHVVWFGEAVPMMDVAVEHVREAELFVVVGTSLVVYPAASLVHLVGLEVPKYIVDPKIPSLPAMSNLHMIEKTAVQGVPELVQQLLDQGREAAA